jgi:long-chain fatty acid transport protein
MAASRTVEWLSAGARRSPKAASGGSHWRYPVSRHPIRAPGRKHLSGHLAASCVAGLILAWTPRVSTGAGFELLHQRDALLGTAFAGTAAVAQDATTAFFNPAGLPLLGRTRGLSGWNLVAGAAVILPSNRFSNSGTIPAPGAPLGTDGGNTGSVSPLPIIDVAYHEGDRWGIGFATGVPYGLKSEYSSDWMGRYLAIKSELTTLQATLSGGFKVAPGWWLGAGVSYFSAKSELTNAVNWGPFGDGQSKLETDAHNWGYNLGALWMPTNATRVGLNYRSGYKLKLSGTIQTTFPGTPAQLALLGPLAQAAYAAANGNAQAWGLNLPSSVTFSVKHSLTPRWDLLADVAWVHWSVFKQFQVVRDNGLVLTNAPQNWTNTWRVAVGATYRLSDSVKLTGGIAYDQSPVPDQYRNPVVPDNDWRWFAFGAQMALSRKVRLDLSYAYISVKKANISASRYDGAGIPDPNSGTLIGSYRTYSNTIAAQIVVDLEK